jgi:uncharacterized repeat protein (TIGR01451 family)
MSCGSSPSASNSPGDSSESDPPGGVTAVSSRTGPAIQIEKATNGFDADSAPGPNIPVGVTVEWTYTVTNVGGVDLARVSVTDDQLGEIRCPTNELLAGEPMTCIATGEAEAGQYANLATVTAEDARGERVRDRDPSHYFGTGDQLAAIDIEKRTNRHDADFGPGPTIPVGETVVWTYEVRNAGNVRLTDVQVRDNPPQRIRCLKDVLEPEESMTCSANGVAIAGEYVNQGTATARFGNRGGSVSDTDPSHYFGADPQVEIQKSTNGEDADRPPGPHLCVRDDVNWTYEVTNTGNVPLGRIRVSDRPEQTIACQKRTLQPDESMTCSASGRARAGQYTNRGRVEASALEDTVVWDVDFSHYNGVEDNVPPVCSDAHASPDTLWPPNHKFVAIEVLRVYDPDGGPVSIMIDSIFQDEPVNGSGDGNTSPDGQGIGKGTAEVRAEREGPGNGRVYHIDFTAYDVCGDTCFGKITVIVPHDKKDLPVDEGPLYDSTVR